MTDFIQQIQYKFKTASVVEKFIYANVVVFVLEWLFASFHLHFIQDWFSLPHQFNQFLSQPWSLVSYGFLHANFPHILFNLIALFYFGNLFTEYFSARKFIHFYLLGTLVGGLLYLLVYNLIPSLKYQSGPLVGASSAVTAILVAMATYLPHYEIKFRFIGFVKLWVIAAIFIAWDIISLPLGNTGGHLAHLGGALFGYLAIKYQTGFDIEILKKPFEKKSPLKTSYKSPSKPIKKSVTPQDVQARVDVILDKIGKSGYEALSKADKEFLFKQGK